MSIIILHTTYYKDKNLSRDLEVQQAIKINCQLSLVDKIILYTQDEFPFKHHKLFFFNISSRPCFKTLVSEFKENAINIVLNSDISFKNDLRKIKDYKFDSNTVFFLSRRLSTRGIFNRLIFKHNTGNSQDAWIFWSKLDNSYLKFLEKIFIGVPGNDNALVYYFKSNGYLVYNPSYSITLNHHHKELIRNYSVIYQNDFPLDFVHSDFSLGYGFVEKFNYFINRLYYKCFQ